ncbi:hypothetical protein HK104_010014 [Borealophlyctis nickersoniae]|nr:hypothetical protein HK104_010014 [Borealophlyctis nickersoniae]
MHRIPDYFASKPIDETESNVLIIVLMINIWNPDGITVLQPAHRGSTKRITRHSMDDRKRDAPVFVHSDLVPTIQLLQLTPLTNMGSSHSSHHADPDTLRAKASEEAKLRNACFEQSRAAYAAGRKAEAKTLSDKGKQHDANMKQLNQQAADAAFAAANGGPDRPPEEVDLHGLHVQEAMEVVEQHIRKCRKAGLKRAVVITGKGNRSVDGVAKIKPAVEELCVRESIRAEPDPHNPGRIILDLDVPKSAVGWFMDSKCIVM